MMQWTKASFNWRHSCLTTEDVQCCPVCFLAHAPSSAEQVHHIPLKCWKNQVMTYNQHLQLSRTLSSSSFGLFFSNESNVALFLSFFPFPLLVLFTGESSGLISEYRLAARAEWREGTGVGVKEQSTRDMNSTWKLPKPEFTARNKYCVPLNCIPLIYTVQRRC